MDYHQQVAFSRFGDGRCPVGIYYQYEGRLHRQVSSNMNGRPQVLVDGELVRVRSLQTAILQPDRSFHPGYIEVLDTKGTVHGTESTTGERQSHATSFRIKIESKNDLEDLNVGFLAYDRVSLGYVVVWSNVGELQAGKERVVRIVVPPVSDNMMEDGFFVPLFFEGGREIRSSKRTKKTNFIINQVMGKTYTRVIESRMAKPSSSVPPMPFMTPLTDEFAEDEKPTGPVYATFTIMADGHVGELTLEGVLTPRVEKRLKMSIESWIYFPEMKNGTPVSRKVKLPLTF